VWKSDHTTHVPTRHPSSCMEDARMQAISGALQKAGGIILRLVRETAIMLARAFAPVVVRSARGGWEDFGLSQMLLLDR